VMRETDPVRLTDQLHVAEDAIFLRWQEMKANPSPTDTEEQEAIRSATNELLTIKIHKLKWPNFVPKG
jgi:hypothetical protein